MKTQLFALCCVALAFTGCTVPFRPPPELAHIELSVASSTQVRVDKLWFDRAPDRGLFLRGYVIRRPEADDTTTTHLDAVFFDASGREIGREVAQFTPAQLPEHRRMRGVGEFEIPLPTLPPATARIEVSAHETDAKKPFQSHP